jgi:hypothetical protein
MIFTYGNSSAMSLFAINSTWNESYINYNNQPGINASNYVNLTGSALVGHLDNWTITNLTKLWINQTVTNYGITIRLTNESTNNISSYNSSETATKPKITLFHSPNISDHTWQQGSNLTNAFNITKYFYDRDNDTLNYTYSGVTHIDVIINNETGMVSFVSEASFSGTETVIFSAHDNFSSTDSNPVSLTVTSISSTPPSSPGGGGGGGRSRTASLDIIINTTQVVNKNETRSIPFYLKNSGEVSLSDISVKATSESGDLILSLDKTRFDKINKDAQVSNMLIVNASEAKTRRYIVFLNASVKNPPLEESAAILIDIFSEKIEIDELIIFAKDLFKVNPECLELQELIDQTEREVEEGNLEKARGTISIAIETCKDMIRHEEEPKSLIPKKDNITPVIIASVILIVIIVGGFLLYNHMKK